MNATIDIQHFQQDSVPFGINIVRSNWMEKQLVNIRIFFYKKQLYKHTASFIIETEKLVSKIKDWPSENISSFQKDVKEAVDASIAYGEIYKKKGYHKLYNQNKVLLRSLCKLDNALAKVIYKNVQVEKTDLSIQKFIAENNAINMSQILSKQ